MVSQSSDPLRIASNGLWGLIGRAWGILATVVANILLARLLDPGDFGRFAIIMSIANTGACLAVFGLNSALVRLISEGIGLGRHERISRAIGLGAILATLTGISVGAIVSLFLFVIPLNIETSATLSLFLGLFVAIVSWQSIAAESIRALGDQRFASFLSGGQSGGPIATSLIVAGLLLSEAVGIHLSEVSALGLHVFIIAAILPFAFVILRRRQVKYQSIKSPVNDTATKDSHDLNLSSLIAICFPLMMIQLLSVIATQGDLWIAGHSLSTNDIANYAVARRLMLLISMPTQIATIVLAPTISQLAAQGNLTALQRILRMSSAVAGLPVIVAIAALLLIGRTLIFLLFGPHYADATELVTILGIGQFAYCFAGSASTALSQTGRQKYALAAIGGSASLLLLFGTPIANSCGVIGLAWFSSCVVLCHSLVVWLMAYKFVGLWTHPDYLEARLRLSAALRNSNGWKEFF